LLMLYLPLLILMLYAKTSIQTQSRPSISETQVETK
jgi:hypothetical protein